MLKALILADRASQHFTTEDLAQLTKDLLGRRDLETELVVLNGDKLAPCLGCFNCWVTTPGLCYLTDDQLNDLCYKEINADMLVLLSKIEYGGFSYDLKAYLDRSIPNISPFFESVNNEVHHKKRYEHFPTIASIGFAAANQEEQATFIKLAERNALNKRCAQHFAVTLTRGNPVKELATFIAELPISKQDATHE